MKYIIVDIDKQREKDEECYICFLGNDGKDCMLNIKKRATKFPNKLCANIASNYLSTNTKVLKI